MNEIWEPSKRTFERWWNSYAPRKADTEIELALDAYRAGVEAAEITEVARRSGVKVLPKLSLMNRIAGGKLTVTLVGDDNGNPATEVDYE